MIPNVLAVISIVRLIWVAIWEETMERGGGVRLMPVPPWNFSSRERMEPEAMVMLGLREW